MVEIIGDFPFMLSPVEAFLGFFSRIELTSLTVPHARRYKIRNRYLNSFFNQLRMVVDKVSGV